MGEDDSILRYYCTYKSGVRTLGCCTYIANVLWYLGYARYQQKIKYPDHALLNYIQDTSNRWNPNNDQLVVDVED